MTDVKLPQSGGSYMRKGTSDLERTSGPEDAKPKSDAQAKSADTKASTKTGGKS